MAEVPRWQKKYEEAGPGFFSREVMLLMKKIQAKYSTDYYKFFSVLGSLYKENASIQCRIEDTQRAIRSVIVSIGTLLGSKGRPATKEEISTLFEMMAFVEDQVTYFKSKSEITKALQQRLVKAEKETGVSLKNIAEVHKEVTKRLTDISVPKKGIAEQMEEFAPEIAKRGKEAVDLLMAGALGPFATVGGMALRTVTGITKAVGKKVTARKEAGLSRALSPVSQYTPLSKLKSIREAMKGGIPISKFVGGLFKPSRASPTEPVSPTIPTLRGTTMLGREKSVGESVTDGLFTFFSKLAFRTKYTKRVVDLLDKISKKSTDFTGGGVKDAVTGGIIGGGIGVAMLSWGKKILVGLGLIFTKFVAPLLVGYFIGTGLRKIFPKIDEYITEIGSEAILKWRKIKLPTLPGLLDKKRAFDKERVIDIGYKRPISEREFELVAGKPSVWNRMKKYVLSTPAERAMAAQYGSTTTSESVYKKSLVTLNTEVIKELKKVKSLPTIGNKEGYVTSKDSSLLLEINNSIKEMSGSIKELTPKVTPTTRQFRNDIYNVRDPLLDALNSGGLDYAF